MNSIILKSKIFNKEKIVLVINNRMVARKRQNAELQIKQEDEWKI